MGVGGRRASGTKAKAGSLTRVGFGMAQGGTGRVCVCAREGQGGGSGDGGGGEQGWGVCGMGAFAGAGGW